MTPALAFLAGAAVMALWAAWCRANRDAGWRAAVDHWRQWGTRMASERDEAIRDRDLSIASLRDWQRHGPVRVEDVS